MHTQQVSSHRKQDREGLPTKLDSTREDTSTGAVGEPQSLIWLVDTPPSASSARPSRCRRGWGEARLCGCAATPSS
jgi:hypothetical protein